ncbi:MAG: Hsp70 family protein [Myxococcales bacterium]|nr:Hsp70 family protein [Myxococcales bacterium]
MKRSIGIDLGTTNSCVATIDSLGKPEIINNKLGEATTPSTVSLRAAPGSDGERPLVGAPAVRRATSNPAETFYGVKRLIGRRFDDTSVQALAATLPYQVVSAANRDAWVAALGVQLSPPELSSIVLRELHDIAEAHFGDSVHEAIITVPAHFDNAERRATVDAAEISGIKMRRLLNEPTAAALGYGAHRGEDQRLAVCDLGGGTFDVSIVNVENGVVEVISSQGDLFLGGDDVDRIIMHELLTELRSEHGLDLIGDSEAMQRLKSEVVSAKHTLSESRPASLELFHLGELVSGKFLDYQRRIERAELNAWVGPVLARLDAPCKEAAARCGLSPHDVNAIVLVGGMTRMPVIQHRIASIFGPPTLKVVNPDEIVSIGAATQCANLDGIIEDLVLLDVTSQALGLLSEDGQYQQVIPCNATIPTREHRILATREDNQRELYFEVYKEGSATPAANRELGRFVCRDLPDAPAGEVMLLVEFTVDVDGILHVATSELGSGEPRELRLMAIAGLNTLRSATPALGERVVSCSPHERGFASQLQAPKSYSLAKLPRPARPYRRVGLW